MYVIIVYDVNVCRVNKIRKFLRQYLDWVQNSVFEGELTVAELERIKLGVLKLIDVGEDSVRIYLLRDASLIQITNLGRTKASLDNII